MTETTKRAAVYARYSTDLQNAASVEDQVRSCKTLIEQQGWDFVEAYSDRAISGATTLRPGYQKLLKAARQGAFDVVVAEALDRLSRDLGDVAQLYKQLTFLGIRLVTLAEGEVGELALGFRGTMNALYLKDLAQKTRRGLEGRVRQGKSGGGLCYGYRVVQETRPDGTVLRGGREIVKAEAKIVRRIFEEFAAGTSPRAIAHRLNREGIPGPRGKPWGPSTIYGNWRRGSGLLNNDLYNGRLVWNRQRFIKDPETGKRVAKANPESEWITTGVPELRILPDELWQQVKDRQAATRSLLTNDGKGIRSERARRPAYLLSGLLKCGACSGGMSKINAHHYGCSNARNRGTCDNKLTIRQDVLEEAVLSGLRSRLMQPHLVKAFIAEYHRELNRRTTSQDTERRETEHRLAKVDRDIQSIVEAIKSGIRSPTLACEIETLEQQKAALQKALAQPPAPPVRIHPNLSEVYRQKVADLRSALNQENTRAEAALILRSMIDEIRLIPKDGDLAIYLVGNLATILDVCTKKNPGRQEGAGVSLTLVAGVGFEPTTFRL